MSLRLSPSRRSDSVGDVSPNSGRNRSKPNLMGRKAQLPRAGSRAHIHASNTFGQRAADRIADSMGSWPFIIWQSVLVFGWIMLNLIGILRHWDPYPFILLNLLFSTQAAYAAPIIMMSQNRQAQKDHLRDDHEAAEVELLFKINQQQLAILNLLHRHALPDTWSESDLEQEIQQRGAELVAEAKEIEKGLNDRGKRTHEG
jgi:uncharacterized membrane protein